MNDTEKQVIRPLAGSSPSNPVSLWFILLPAAPENCMAWLDAVHSLTQAGWIKRLPDTKVEIDRLAQTDHPWKRMWYCVSEEHREEAEAIYHTVDETWLRIS